MSRHYPIQAEHPYVAGTLCLVAERFANAAEAIVNHPWFLPLGLAVALALLWARVTGVAI